MMKKKYLYDLLPLIGVIFCLWYLKNAVYDVVYTDYIRIVNTYLPDVFNPDKFFVPDVLTRIPINYLSRMVNVTLFGFRTTFDMALGAISLGFAGWCIGKYSKENKISFGWYMMLTFLMFSLNKWEMLTNGTGWAHFLALGCFYFHFIILDRTYQGNASEKDHLILLLLPFIITMGIAGPYCASYTAILLFSYGYCYFIDKKSSVNKKRYIQYTVCAIIPFLLYLLSNHFAVEDHAGAVDQSILETVIQQPGLLPRFLVKAWASVIVGTEQINKFKIPVQIVFLLGVSVLLMYLFAFFINIKYRLYKKTILPSMLLIMGMLNHGMVLISRWIFLKDSYGMSSRYALQYQVGIIGVILTVCLPFKQFEQRWIKVTAVSICCLVLAGNGFVTVEELKMAPHRETYGSEIHDVAIRFEEVSDEVLRAHFDYRPGREDSGAKVRSALEILKENNLNVFRR